MSSILKVDTIQDQDGNNIINESGNVITIGASGDTITVPAGATVSGFTSAGIDDNATSVAITIDSNENVGIGTTSPNNYSGYGNLTLNGTSGGIFDLEVNGTRTGTLLGLVGETRLASITNIPVTFQVNNAEKMRLTSTGLGIGTSNPSATVGTDNVLEVAGSVSPGLVINDTGQAEKYQLYADSTKFKMNYGSTNFLTYDASNSNLGLGTTSPGRTLDVAGIVRSSTAFALGGNTSTPSEGSAIYRPASDNLAFVTNNNERARFDSAGRFLYGKTADDNSVQGVKLTGGQIVGTVANDDIMILNRTGSDGKILRFFKDTADFASIGVNTGNNPFFSGSASNHGGIMFSDAGASQPTMLPMSGGTTLANNSLNLGTSSYRYKDIYLGNSIDLSKSTSEAQVNIRSTVTPNGSKRGGVLNLSLGSGSISGSGNTSTQVGDALGEIIFNGQGTDYAFQGGGIEVKQSTPNGQTNRTDAGCDMLFKVIGAGNTGYQERLRIKSTGGITFNGDTSVNNALDDYEVGTWTPALKISGSTTGIAYSVQSGHYTKIGNRVIANAEILLTSKGSNTGNISLIGLPFSTDNDNYQTGYTYNDRVSAPNGDIQPYLNKNTTTGTFYQSRTDGTSNGHITGNEMNDTSYLLVSFVYRTA